MGTAVQANSSPGGEEGGLGTAELVSGCENAAVFTENVCDRGICTEVSPMRGVQVDATQRQQRKKKRLTRVGRQVRR